MSKIFHCLGSKIFQGSESETFQGSGTEIMQGLRFFLFKVSGLGLEFLGFSFCEAFRVRT